MIMMRGDSMLEYKYMSCPEISICRKDPYPNGGLIADIILVDIDILRMLNITKYIKATRHRNEVWMSISRIYWGDIITRCNDTIIDACRMIISIHDSDDEINKDEDSETIDILINMIRVVSDIAFKLQYAIDNFDDESPSVFIDMNESDRLKLGIDIA